MSFIAINKAVLVDSPRALPEIAKTFIPNRSYTKRPRHPGPVFPSGSRLQLYGCNSDIVAALVITWVTIIVAHLRFRQAADAGNMQPSFRAPLSPLSNYLCLAAMVLVVGVMLLTPAIRGSALAIPIWVLVVFWVYRVVPLASGGR